MLKVRLVAALGLLIAATAIGSGDYPFRVYPPVTDVPALLRGALLTTEQLGGAWRTNASRAIGLLNPCGPNSGASSANVREILNTSATTSRSQINEDIGVFSSEAGAIRFVGARVDECTKLGFAPASVSERGDQILAMTQPTDLKEDIGFLVHTRNIAIIRRGRAVMVLFYWVSDNDLDASLMKRLVAVADGDFAVAARRLAPVAVPAASPLPTPTSSATPAPAVTGGGWLVYLRAGDLHVGTLDGSSDQQLTSGAPFPDFAGSARDSTGAIWVYYTSLAERQDGRGPTLRVDRQQLGGSTSEELFTFQANVQEVASSGPIATVSPDGRYVAYTDERGLRLYDVAAHSERGLLSNRPQSPTNTPGNIYLNPLWAPAGGWLVVTRTGCPPFDKPTLDFIRPLEPITEYTADAGGAFRAWSADGTTLCASRAGYFNNGFTFADVGLVTAGQPGFQVLLHALKPDKPGALPTLFHANACSWSRDGRVAISYGIERTNTGAATVFNTTGSILSGVAMFGTFGVVGWSPDGNGLIRSVEDAYLGNHNIVLMLDGSFRSVPFGPERILAVIPPP